MNEKRKTGGTSPVAWVIVLIFGGFSLLACSGILAAIAIPAFLRYIKASKSSEAEVTVRQLSSSAQMHYLENCKFPPNLEPTADPTTCCGGEKCLPAVVVDPWGSAVPSLSGPMYFSYAAINGGTTMQIVATSDFSCGGPQHTVTVELVGDPEACEATASPSYTENEFE